MVDKRKSRMGQGTHPASTLRLEALENSEYGAIIPVLRVFAVHFFVTHCNNSCSKGSREHRGDQSGEGRHDEHFSSPSGSVSGLSYGSAGLTLLQSWQSALLVLSRNGFREATQVQVRQLLRLSSTRQAFPNPQRQDFSLVPSGFLDPVWLTDYESRPEALLNGAFMPCSGSGTGLDRPFCLQPGGIRDKRRRTFLGLR